MPSVRQGLSSLAPGGDKMRDPGNEVVETNKQWEGLISVARAFKPQANQSVWTTRRFCLFLIFILSICLQYTCKFSKDEALLPCNIAYSLFKNVHYHKRKYILK